MLDTADRIPIGELESNFIVADGTDSQKYCLTDQTLSNQVRWWPGERFHTLFEQKFDSLRSKKARSQPVIEFENDVAT